MNINKAVMTTDGPAIKFSMPISKVDVQRRLVSGFATLDNKDSHGDIVTAEASARAFARFRGNIREMHAPVAVGKLVSFEDQSYYDPITEKFYDGVYVTAYISTGAEDTWQKILDGTLTGFSIGGSVIDYETLIDKDSGEQARAITDYQLVELSVVDNPANQLANIFSITKNQSNDQIMTGIAVGVQVENILYCPNDEFIVATKKEAGNCAECGDSLKNIGWVESNASNKVDVAKSLVADYIASHTVNLPLEKIDGIIEAKATEFFAKGGTVMGKEAEQGAEQVVELDEAKAVDTVDGDSGVVEDEAGVAAPAAEEEPAVEEVESPDFTKMLSDFAEEIKKSVVEAQAQQSAAVEEVKGEFSKSIDELNTKISDLASKVEEVSAANSDVSKSVEELVGEASIRKSADVNGSTSTEKRSFWGNSFLSVD